MLRCVMHPTQDVTINDLQIALLNFQVAKERGEDFIVRIKDTDSTTQSDEKNNLLETLELFGIQYSQVIQQSQNIRFHAAMALQLLHEKKAFNCFCSNAWIEKKEQEAANSKQRYMYDDACRNLPAELVIDNENPFVVRINKPQHSETIDSFVILHQDKTPTQEFASAVDDMLSDISLIIDDTSKQESCQRQEHIRDQLGYEKKIEYRYIQALQSDVSIKTLLSEGYLPEAISNYLVSDDIGLNFDIEALKEMNRQHLLNMDNKELSRYVGFADAEIGALAKLYLENVYTTKELKDKIAPVFAKRKIPKELSQEYEKLKNIVATLPYFEVFKSFEESVEEKLQLQTPEDMKLLISYFFLNSPDGLEAEKVYNCLKNYIGELVKC